MLTGAFAARAVAPRALEFGLDADLGREYGGRTMGAGRKRARTATRKTRKPPVAREDYERLAADERASRRDLGEATERAVAAALRKQKRGR